jgi:hypothetical protein
MITSSINKEKLVQIFINKKSGLFSSSTEGIKEYFRRKPLHQKKLKIKFIGTVDTSKSVKSQLLKIVPKIK